MTPTHPESELVALLHPLEYYVEAARSQIGSCRPDWDVDEADFWDGLTAVLDAMTRAATVPQGVSVPDGFAVRYPSGEIELTSIRKTEHASQWAQGSWTKMAAQGFTCVPVKVTATTPPPAELGKGS